MENRQKATPKEKKAIRRAMPLQIPRRLQSLGRVPHMPGRLHLPTAAGQLAPIPPGPALPFVHTPDRPSDSVHPANLPSEADCLADIKAWQGKNEEQRQRGTQDPPPALDTFLAGMSGAAQNKPQPPVLSREWQRIEATQKRDGIAHFPSNSTFVSKESGVDLHHAKMDLTHEDPRKADDDREGGSMGTSVFSNASSTMALCNFTGDEDELSDADEASGEPKAVDTGRLIRIEKYKRGDLSSLSPALYRPQQM